MSRKTMFFNFRDTASAVYRVTTESSVYLVGFHRDRDRRYVVVRGLPGTDREHVVLRDSDPRIGQASMFTVMPTEWVGQTMEVATMASSAIVSVSAETDRALIAAVGGDSPSAATWATAAAPRVPSPTSGPPLGTSSGLGRGTSPMIPAAASRGVAHHVVVGQAPPAQPAEPEVPYPRRQVMYAETAALYLRGIARRDHLFDDVAADRELKDRLNRALDDCAELLQLIQRRNRR